MNVIATATGTGFTIVFDQKFWSDSVTKDTAQNVVDLTVEAIRTENRQEEFKGEYSLEKCVLITWYLPMTNVNRGPLLPLKDSIMRKMQTLWS